MQKLFCAKGRVFFLVMATSLVRNYALHPQLMECGEREGVQSLELILQVMFCLISPVIELDWSSNGNESKGTENLDVNQIWQKNSISQPSTSIAVNETPL